MDPSRYTTPYYVRRYDSRLCHVGMLDGVGDDEIGNDGHLPHF